MQMDCMEELQTPRTNVEASQLLPGLPEELALLCLACLPLSARRRCSCVSRALRRILSDDALLQHVRRKYGIGARTLVFLRLAQAGAEEESEYDDVNRDLWVILDPVRTGSSCDVLFDLYQTPFADALRVVAARWLQMTQADYPELVMLCGMSGEEYHWNSTSEAALPSAMADAINEDRMFIFDFGDIVSFDLASRRWRRTVIAWAQLGDHLYVSGGWSDDYIFQWDHFGTEARRYSFTTKAWESLPSTHERRQGSLGFALNGCFYLLGGLSDHEQLLHSGEFFNPSSSTWTLVPNMWPYDEWLNGPPHVAVVNDRLYALKPMTTQIILYETLRKCWASCGSLPQGCSPAAGHRLVGVRNELWVLLNYDDVNPISVLSCTPQSTHTILDWRTLLFDLPGDLRILDCVAIEV